jgi:osmotically-inducible protein OsmY
MIIDAHKVKEQITKELERNARLDASKVVVQVIGKKIILKGVVRNLEEVDEAVRAVWSIPGVSEVQDHLKIA